MGIYLVDYENVNCPGLNGIEELSKKDVVIVFYTTSANRIDISVFKKIRAKLSFILAESGTANALDFQLVTYLCRNAKKRKDYYIVSGDKGYSPVIHMLQEEGICVTEVPCIRAALANSNYETLIETNNIIPLEIAQKQTTEESGKTFYESKVEENDPVTEIAVIIMSKLGVYPADEMMNLIIKGLKTTYTKSEFYTFCTQNMGPAAGQTFYSKIKKSYDDMRELAALVS